MGVAGGLVDKLPVIDGFISVENFKSLTEENKVTTIIDGIYCNSALPVYLLVY